MTLLERRQFSPWVWAYAATLIFARAFVWLAGHRRVFVLDQSIMFNGGWRVYQGQYHTAKSSNLIAERVAVTNKEYRHQRRHGHVACGAIPVREGPPSLRDRRDGHRCCGQHNYSNSNVPK